MSMERLLTNFPELIFKKMPILSSALFRILKVLPTLPQVKMIMPTKEA